MAQVADLLALPDADVPQGNDAKYEARKQPAASLVPSEGGKAKAQHAEALPCAQAKSQAHASRPLASAGGDDLADDFDEVEVEDDVAALSAEDLAAKKRKEERARRKAKKRKLMVCFLDWTCVLSAKMLRTLPLCRWSCSGALSLTA